MANHSESFDSSEDEDFENESQSESEDDDLPASASKNNLPVLQGYSDIGDPLFECQKCGAHMWYQERRGKSRDSATPTFQLCCGNGKVQLPLLKHAPQSLQDLLFDPNNKQSKHFQQNIRMYNSMFSFTSPGMKFDKKYNEGRGPPILRLHGQPCHRIGSMLPEEGEAPKFAQLYIYDTDNEVANRIQSCGNNKSIDAEVVTKLGQMLDEYNVHAKAFRMARDKIQTGNVKELKLRLIHDRNTDGRIYNHPTVSEVAALIVGDVDAGDTRDIIIQEQGGQLERINEFHSAYLGYKYPLIFPYGEDGFRRGTLHKERPGVIITKRNRLTIMDWLSFRIQMRRFEAKTLVCSRRLFQQFLVDGFTMMEAERLSFVRNNQSTLRVCKYQKLNVSTDNHPKSGKRVVLPSTFVGSKRYMDQLYFDGMAISAAVGFPDLFITFTCNPNWPEIKRLLAKQNLKAHDRPDIISRVFKIKFNELLKYLTKKHVLGQVIAYLYTIEFQKRGLPHAHILLFLHPSSKYPAPDDINKIISAEVPNPETQKELYFLVKTHMIHGPCGHTHTKSPCMRDGPTCYDDLKKIGDTQYVSYRDACFAMGFLEDDREYINAIKEAKDWGSGHFLRKLFVIILLANSMNRPRHVWDETKIWLSDGILYNQRIIAHNKGLLLTDAQIENLTLIEIEKLLQANNRSLSDFPCIPYPNNYVTANLGNRLIYNELNYDVQEQKEQFQKLFKSLTDEQRNIYHTIMKAVRKQQGGVFFLTWLWRNWKNFRVCTLASSLRSRSQIVLTVASSGITSLLLPGGRTAHSKFKIPVPTLDNSVCEIEHNDDRAGLLKQTKLIIWDEAPMAHRFTFEALERTLRDSNDNSDEIKKFSDWLLKEGEGKLSVPNDGYAAVDIPKELLIIDYDEPIPAIVESTYPNLIEQYTSQEFLQSRAILASTIEVVDQINTYVLSLTPGECKDFYSCDSIDRSDINDCTPIMLMRNLAQSEGLCNGTRLVVTKFANHVIEAKIISGKNIGNVLYIPRMKMSPSQSPWPFKLNRIQFPIVVSYAMTINKSQGQSLDHVGLYLPKDVFSHGQLYVAMSRVTTKMGLKILIHDADNKEGELRPTTTTNVVFKEVFSNL
ncbi:hypothetical protein TSUD_376720 [Trifolium subterraneum]|uniref:ATP-dependent DNA helicase n=1 Tax=Trifolium subterraneum TaxID=3900 RepID=A0A2Z6PQ50_TRISU|nr:hypothetical protein TSUD_376720 [Trifolium subterraneum]